MEKLNVGFCVGILTCLSKIFFSVVKAQAKHNLSTKDSSETMLNSSDKLTNINGVSEIVLLYKSSDKLIES